MTLLNRALLTGLLAFASLPAMAAAYVFPGTLPAGCSGSGPSYTCGALTLANTDTLTLASPTPATITVNGNLTANKAKINASGSAANLTLVVNGALTTGNLAAINANVTATSVTDSGGKVAFGGSLTATTGGITLAASSTVAGNVVTTNGNITLGASAAAAQCVQSSGTGTITFASNASAGGVCCGATGSCSSTCVVNNSGSPQPALCGGGVNPSNAGRFNAFDTGTTAGSTSGVIHTKIAGSAFSLAIAAINTAGSGLASSFSGSVKVELLDSSDNSGAVTASSGCRGSWAVAAGTSASTLSFAASDAGRKNVTLTVANAWRDARVRISYPATGTATSVGCSSDNFALRPAAFSTPSATDATLLTAGTARALANTALTGGKVHKAGQPFTLSTTAKNGAATPVTTTKYTGTPLAFVTACSGAACSSTLGVLSFVPTATLGVVSTSTASYSEAGAFSLQLVDSAFAIVDANDGSTPAEMSVVSPVIAVGRFVPDHFDITPLVTPVLRTFNSNSSACPTRSFTYLGQPFGYDTAPQAMVIARNAAGETTANYPDAKLNALVVTQSYTLASGATSVYVGGITAPTRSANGNGTALLAAQASDTLTLVRPANTLLPFNMLPFNADIALAWSVADNSETGSGNGSITTPTPLAMNNIAFDAATPTNPANEFRFGLLKLGSAYGSELLNLAVPIELQYWNGNAFVTNTDDQCSTLPTSSLALGNYRSNLAACETAPSPATLSFSNGRSLLRMQAPGSGNGGSVDATLNLGKTASGQQCSAAGTPASAATPANMPWLQMKSGAATAYTVNPSARFSFGQYRSPLINLREVY